MRARLHGGQQLLVTTRARADGREYRGELLLVAPISEYLLQSRVHLGEALLDLTPWLQLTEPAVQALMQLALYCKHRSKPTNTYQYVTKSRQAEPGRKGLHLLSGHSGSCYSGFGGSTSTGRTPDKTRMQVGAVFISRIVAALRPVQIAFNLRHDCRAARTTAEQRETARTTERGSPRTTKVA